MFCNQIFSFWECVCCLACRKWWHWRRLTRKWYWTQQMRQRVKWWRRRRKRFAISRIFLLQKKRRFVCLSAWSKWSMLRWFLKSQKLKIRTITMYWCWFFWTFYSRCFQFLLLRCSWMPLIAKHSVFRYFLFWNLSYIGCVFILFDQFNIQMVAWIYAFCFSIKPSDYFLYELLFRKKFTWQLFGLFGKFFNFLFLNFSMNETFSSSKIAFCFLWFFLAGVESSVNSSWTQSEAILFFI